MKKSLLIVAAVLMMSGAAFAGGGFDLSVGPKVGYQTAKLSYQKDDIKAGFMNHFTVGLFGRVEIGGFYVQPEALWFNTSNAFTLNTNVQQDVVIGDITIPSGADVDFTLNAMNIQVPIMLGYKLDLVGGLLAVRAQAGPTLNFTIPQQTLVSEAVGGATPAEISNNTDWGQYIDTNNISDTHTNMFMVTIGYKFL